MKKNELSKAECERLIGVRLQEARLSAGMSRSEAAKILGVSHQQFEKYEKGLNRVSAGALFLLSHAFHRPMDWFTESLSDYIRPSQSKESRSQNRFLLRVMSLLRNIDDSRTQKTILRMVGFFSDFTECKKDEAKEKRKVRGKRQ